MELSCHPLLLGQLPVEKRLQHLLALLARVVDRKLRHALSRD